MTQVSELVDAAASLPPELSLLAVALVAGVMARVADRYGFARRLRDRLSSLRRPLDEGSEP